MCSILQGKLPLCWSWNTGKSGITFTIYYFNIALNLKLSFIMDILLHHTVKRVILDCTIQRPKPLIDFYVEKRVTHKQCTSWIYFRLTLSVPPFLFFSFLPSFLLCFFLFFLTAFLLSCLPSFCQYSDPFLFILMEIIFHWEYDFSWAMFLPLPDVSYIVTVIDIAL